MTSINKKYFETHKYNEISKDIFKKQLNTIHDYHNDTNETTNDQFIIDACQTSNLSIIENYFNNGHEINKCLINGCTLLLYAASYTQPKVIQYLLNLGGDPNLHYEGYTPLMALCNSIKGSNNERMKCLKYLIKAKANVNATNKYKETALMYACKIQDNEFVLEILKYVSDINSFNNQKMTALFYAVTSNRYDITKILIEKGADINWLNCDGIKAYDIAAAKRYDKLVTLFDTNCYECHTNIKKIKHMSPWIDMLQDEKDYINSDILSLLYGMGLENYSSCFSGIDLKKFLNLQNEDLIKLGVDISVHRKKIANELLKFHKQTWKNNLIKINKSELFTGFEAIAMIENIKKQLTVISSSIYFSKNLLNVIEENNESILYDENDQIKEIINNMISTISKIKKSTNLIKILANDINKKNSNLSLPIFIDKNIKKTNYKWFVTCIISLTSLCIFKYIVRNN